MRVSPVPAWLTLLSVLFWLVSFAVALGSGDNEKALVRFLFAWVTLLAARLEDFRRKA